MGRIYAFEPQRPIFQILTGNVALNNFYNVWTYPYGLGDSRRTVEFQEPDYFSNADYGVFSLVQEKIPATGPHKNVVDIVTLDWFMEHYHVPKIDLLKIDAEGMDLEVLTGGIETIDQHRPVIFIEHCDNQRSIRESLELWLSKFNYKFVVEGNNLLATQ